MSSGKELITPPPPQLIQEGKWSYKAKVLQSRSPSDVTPMSLDTQFVEEDHIQMGNLVDGNAYVHVYKMKFAGELLDYIPFIVCGDQKLVYYYLAFHLSDSPVDIIPSPLPPDGGDIVDD